MDPFSNFLTQNLSLIIIFSSQLKSALSFAGFNPQYYKSHSFRIGAVTFAAQNGVPELAIRQFGRWKSDATKKYIRIAFAKT